MKVAVLGEGSWGTAIATLLAAQNIEVKLWCHDATVAQAIKNTHKNDKYLPGIFLDKQIVPVVDLDQTIKDVEWIFEAIPVKFLRDVVQQVKNVVSSSQHWVILSKGIEQQSLLFPSQIVDDVLEYKALKAVMLGPSFARDLAEKTNYRRNTCLI